MKKEIDEQVQSIDDFSGIVVPDSDDSEGDDEESDDKESDNDSARPDKNDWVASWNKKDPRELKTWIDVYAYFRKEQGDGGYGVILRNVVGKPIVASAKHSAEGKSFFFYQVLLGIKVGLKLAERHVLFDHSVRCNSIKVPQLILDARRCDDVKCKETTEIDNICKGCRSYLNFYAGGDVGLLPLIQDLKRQKFLPVAGFSRVSNEAAHYLAKMAKNKRLAGEEHNEIKPDAFPPELKDILWEDVIRSFSYRLVPWY
ncbi:uncharacterized protein LOC113319522 [Papaver somniferum]|uniref:uncharacterized protein LOC113319522 n=1 Tax=Papaver somniferum TaxID=3469 RepID=UPI000E6F9A05|nr:uncharacterized protein LOC113319522 [Papaver somniferum]